MMNVNAVADIAEKAHARIGQNFLEDAGDRLEGLVIRSDAIAHQSKGWGETIDEVYHQCQTFSFQQSFSRVKATRPSADDSDAQRPRRGTKLFHASSPLSRFCCLSLEHALSTRRAHPAQP